MYRRLVAAAVLTVLGFGPANAAMDAKQVQIAAKALGFLAKKPAPGSKIVVVGSAAAVADVTAALPGMSVAAGSAADGASAFAVFVSTAAEATAAKGAGVVTIGSAVACVDAGACVLAIETQPKVTIYVSKAAATAAGVSFDANFKMMITEK